MKQIEPSALNVLEYAKKRFSYDRASGRFYWCLGKRVGVRACFVDKQYGYVKINIRRRLFMAHRIVWLFENGDWPNGQIDHINLDKSDNRIKNLRVVSQSENLCNRALQKNNSSGFKGVYRRQDGGRWRAIITKDRKRYSLGDYHSPELAFAAYCDAAEKIHGQFARLS